jgi:uncharacterized protein YuzB (UPF0349 family)
MGIFPENITPTVAQNNLENDPNARIVEHKVIGSCTTIHFLLAKHPFFAIFDGDSLLGVWPLLNRSRECEW